MPTLPNDHTQRVARATLSLTGLSLGDAFGERFFGPRDHVQRVIASRMLPPPPWRYTDDTVMALSIVEVMDQFGHIDQDALAHAFGARYAADPDRGYGPGAHRLLRAIATGADWRVAARTLFGGSGSFGNGGAMRVAPVGAYFADDLRRAALEARRSAEVTHAHPEGQAGAIAVALAAACCATGSMDPDRFFNTVLEHTPESATRRGIVAARDLVSGTTVAEAVRMLGNGSDGSAQDTVPFVIWCIARFHVDFVEAMWATVSGLGDRDTTCAMVGGCVALSHNGASIPQSWLTAREPLSRLSGPGLVADCAAPGA